MKGMVALKKVQIKLFDGRRNQNFWFHFCYISKDLWVRYTKRFKVQNIDSQVKMWIAQDFDIEITTMEDLYTVKDHIKEIYSKIYPDVYMDSVGDRQGWVRVWLTDKLKKILEVE